MTDIQLKALDLLRESGGEFVGTSALGFALWPNGSEHRTAQGMALAAGKVMRGLIDLGEVRETMRGRLTVFKLANK